MTAGGLDTACIVEKFYRFIVAIMRRTELNNNNNNDNKIGHGNSTFCHNVHSCFVAVAFHFVSLLIDLSTRLAALIQDLYRNFIYSILISTFFPGGFCACCLLH